MTDLSLFATVPRGLESLLAGELRGLGAAHVKQVRAGVAFAGSLETAYRACLWSRLAGRVLLPVTSGKAADGDELYKTAQAVDWSRHLGVDDTLAVDFTGVNDRIRDTRFGAVRIKDAIVDQFRATSGGKRPSVDARAPDVRVNAHLASTRVAISIDLSGQSLHRRGYRADKVQVEAPLKENLAAGLLLYAAWPSEAAAGASLLDPLCGSGTLPIEAALMAADVAPGLLRAEAEVKPGAAPAFGFLHWRGHDAALWDALLLEARERRGAGIKRLAAARPGVAIRGSDRDERAVKVARDFVKRAGLHGLVAIDHAQLDTVAAPAERGLLATNAPYGERLEAADTEAVYRQLGERLREAFPGWNAVVLAGDQRQLKAIGLAPKRETDLRNGPLECVLAYYEAGAAPTGAAAPRTARAEARSSSRKTTPPEATAAVAETPAAGRAGGPSRRPQPVRAERSAAAPSTWPTGCARTSAGWPSACSARASPATASTTPTCPSTTSSSTCTASGCTCRSTRRRPRSTPDKAKRRLAEAVEVIGAVLETPPQRVVLKERRRQRGAAQYERRGDAGKLLEVSEDDLTYLVDLEHLPGHRLLHRPAAHAPAGPPPGRRPPLPQPLRLHRHHDGERPRRRVAGVDHRRPLGDLSDVGRAEPHGQRLRCRRARSGRRRRRSRTPRPRAATGRRRAPRRTEAPPPRTPSCRPTACAGSPRPAAQYDLIWLDPPTFSNSKKMGRATFDVQRDHADLIRLTARRLLAPGGILLFATNLRNFRLDHAELRRPRASRTSRARPSPSTASAAPTATTCSASSSPLADAPRPPAFARADRLGRAHPASDSPPGSTARRLPRSPPG